eukprot:Gb_32215 [translate_table: standard]
MRDPELIDNESESRTCVLSGCGLFPNQFLEGILLLDEVREHVCSTVALQAQASTSCNSKEPIYHVFINHRGPDTKKTLASLFYYHLHDVLKLEVFFDREELEVGDCLPLTIQHALKTACVHIAIFSQRYAESAWCLAELCLMLESGRKILPIFYDVKPSDLRSVVKDGVYARAFNSHQQKQRFSSQTLEKWKQALTQLSYQSGSVFDSRNDDLGILLKTIVKSVSKHVKRELYEDTSRLVGLDEEVEDLQNTIFEGYGEQTENAKIVGIVGMGGVGKTTLATRFFNLKHSEYGKSCFLPDVRETARTKGLPYLQTTFLKDLGLHDDEIRHINQGKQVLGRCLNHENNLLIVLDDVDDANQIDALLIKLDALGSRSLVLVCSRDKGLLNRSGISLLHHVKLLHEKHARELFCWQAFLQPFPREGFEDLVQGFLNVCKGLPLSLKVFGALVYGKRNRSYWELEIKEISKRLDSNIMKTLRISYDALEEEEKEIFLDICCFFLGEDKDMAVRVWDGSGWSGLHALTTLEHRCLVELDDKNRLKMHDHLRDLGRHIAKSSRPDRLWCPLALDECLKRPSESLDVRGICTGDQLLYRKTYKKQQRLLNCKNSRQSVIISSVDARGLKLLVLNNKFVKLRGDQLIWLRWYNCPYKRIPSDGFSMQSLRVLEVIDGSLERLWRSNSQLREMNISSSWLEKFPNSIGALQFLEKLVLSKGSRIKSLPQEFCRLHSLKHLELKECEELKSLPFRFGDLTNLQYLDLYKCNKLQALPTSFDQLIQLRFLSFTWCESLSFPENILEKMWTLEHLDLSYCKKLKAVPTQIKCHRYLKTLLLEGTCLRNLPDEFADLSNLEYLLVGSSFLTTLPPSLWNLSCLMSLELRDCSGMNNLPESLGQLTRLERLLICHANLEYLPEGVRQLSNLQMLDISGCPIREVRLSSVTKEGEEETSEKENTDLSAPLPPSVQNCMLRLRVIDLSYTSVSHISIDEGVCPNLIHLILVNCLRLVEVETLPSTLVRLTMLECRPLRKITAFTKDFPNLEHLNISDCGDLEELPSLAHFRSLEFIRIEGCSKLQSIFGVEQLKRLKRVQITGGNGSEIHRLQMGPAYCYFMAIETEENALHHIKKCTVPYDPTDTSDSDTSVEI